ncbi:unknown substrate ABC transporter permease component [Mesoplasma florum L1]|uniref:ABC transporter ATP-binding protein n=1 Tax=Mesoplasma florum (strain ATCC 33453 / NBRC 100688 / NCTC 11704 / L1) TaxID=265311 RepID=Q6F1U8_MESFL|nr:ABC transporter ATP-binding protein [Mesoplasma florum]AAT75525.1 unknown substrate ABC transporter permease component [Mesoplasma florum L1]
MGKVYKTNKIGILFFTILSFISALGLVFSGYVISFIVNTAVDVINGEAEKTSRLFILIIICAISFSICIIFGYFQKQVKNKIIKDFNLLLRQRISNKIINLDLNDLNSKNNGDFISWYTNDINQIEAKNFENTFDFIDTFLTAILSIIAIFILNWIVGLATIFALLLLMIIPSLLQKSMVKTINKVSTKQEEFSAKVENTISGYKELLYNNKTELFKKMIDEKSLDLENYKQKNKTLENLQMTGINFISIFCQIGLLLLTVILATYKLGSIGMVFAVPQLAGNFLVNARTALGSLFGTLGSRELFSKFDYDHKNFKDLKLENFKSLIVKDLELKINDVTLYKGLNIEINKGDKYLIHGRSGVGKSTLIKILFGTLNGYSGEILWNNKINFNTIESNALWDKIYYVQQDTTIFDASFKENITLFDDKISDSQIQKVISLVNLNELVLKNNNSLTFSCKELSKGEIQRISVARALLSNKKIIFLDEPTASLDKQNAELIEELILKNPDLTVLFISHTSNIKNKLFNGTIHIK